MSLLLLLFQIIISGPLTVAASTEKKIIVVRIGGTEVRRYDTAVGKKSHATPTGRFITTPAQYSTSIKERSNPA